MTVHDFIVIYNETFQYIESKFGADKVLNLWSTISTQWCTHLRELVESKGLEGMLEYWGGNGGTLSREKAEYEAALEDGIFTGVMHKCPSVGELLYKGRKIYHGEKTYCDHCSALYAPIANAFGFNMHWEVEYDKSGDCTGRCKWTAYREGAK